MDHAGTERLGFRCRFVRGGMQNGAIDLEYVAAGGVIADILSKPLSGHRFGKLLHSFGIRLMYFTD